MKLEDKLNIWKNKLLDLGKRNNLLNFKFNRKTTLQILSPSIYDLWDSFVVQEKPLVFPVYEIVELDENENENNENNKGITTNKTKNELQKTLRSLRDKAKTITEEQGVNVLYLTFGYLHWKDSRDSNVYFDAPIVLVPVTLLWENITAPFKLVVNEDDITINPTLLYKLENDFGIKLPEFDVESDLEIYLKKINNVVSKNEWSVSENVALGLLSFLKLNMYRDLENFKDKIYGNKIIKAIAGDGKALAEEGKDVIDVLGNDVDKSIKPESVFQVVDADSSQQEAILCAKKGVSFVLQGPPGTGKSQTITNIIAECLADGKKILFVSEKMAALQVVYKRLQDTGLDDFVLLMHNHKANKKAIMDQFASVLKLSNKKLTVRDELYQKLNNLYELRNELNEYADAIYQNISPLNKTIYEVNGNLAKLQDYPDLTFDIRNVESKTNQDLIGYIALLKKYVATLNKMGSNIDSNPWFGSNIETLTHGLRQDIVFYISKFKEQIKNIDDCATELNNELCIDCIATTSNIRMLKDVLRVASKGENIPVGWILGNDITPFNEEIRQCNDTKIKFLALRQKIRDEHIRLSNDDSSMEFIRNDILATREQIEQYIYGILEFIKANDLYSSLYAVSDLAYVDKTLKNLEEQLNAIQEVYNAITVNYEKEIFGIDYDSMYLRFKTEYTSFFKHLKSSYRNDKKIIKSCHRNRNVNISDDEIFNLLGELRDLDAAKENLEQSKGDYERCFGKYFKGIDTDINLLNEKLGIFKIIISCLEYCTELKKIVLINEEQEAILKMHYEALYQGIETDWDFVRMHLNWALEFKNVISKVSVSEVYIKNVCTDKVYRDRSNYYVDLLTKAYDAFDEYFRWFASLFVDGSKFDEFLLTDLMQRAEQCFNNLELLEDWIDYRDIRKECVAGGLLSYLNILDLQKNNPNDIIGAFKKRFYKLWLDSVIIKFKAVSNFRRKIQDKTIENFKALDRQQLDIAKLRIREKMVNSLPPLDRFTSGLGEISILKREMNKSRRIMPIRRLFANIPNIVLTLKPCLMMSPLSVSLFLEANSFEFDVVIFDEASQICTENAIGAIVRGKQVIIAGDSKQLPPTNFFNASTSSNEFDDDGEDDEGYESVLDEAVLLPEKTLLWHYRSRHEHLIAFSNAKIYKNQLITFPSNMENLPDSGVEYIYVDGGSYDRGGRRGNVIEAQKVAELVFEHFQKYKTTGLKRSLGVIAFGEAQQTAIDTSLRKLRMERPEFEQFFSEEIEEPFFVKNLENVQGDERDTIIFSIGYAKTDTGVMYMNFGPLSKLGGERRLNVAITRAKYNVKLVGSILPADIDVDRITSEGPKLLRAYIDFAMRGPVVLESAVEESDVVQFDSPFEEAVYNYLDRKGFKVVTQVGCSGYRIDMAVKHPNVSGCYVLGIECDGAAYHSAKNARERDRLRQDVLENMGWNIYRIWSTDWIKDPITEGERLISAIQKAIEMYDNNQVYNPGSIDASSENSIVPNHDELIVDSMSNKINKNVVDDELNNDEKTFEKSWDKFIEVAERTNVNDDFYEFGQIEEFDVSTIREHWNESRIVYECIKFHLEHNSPIHFDFLCKKCCVALNKPRVSKSIKTLVYEILSEGFPGYLESSGQFFFPRKIPNLKPRMAGGRTLEQISITEMVVGLKVVASKYKEKLPKDLLISETAKAFGFMRRTNDLVVAFGKAYRIIKW